MESMASLLRRGPDEWEAGERDCDWDLDLWTEARGATAAAAREGPDDDVDSPRPSFLAPPTGIPTSRETFFWLFSMSTAESAYHGGASASDSGDKDRDRRNLFTLIVENSKGDADVKALMDKVISDNFANVAVCAGQRSVLVPPASKLKGLSKDGFLALFLRGPNVDPTGSKKDAKSINAFEYKLSGTKASPVLDGKKLTTVASTDRFAVYKIDDLPKGIRAPREAKEGKDAAGGSIFGGGDDQAYSEGGNPWYLTYSGSRLRSAIIDAYTVGLDTVMPEELIFKYLLCDLCMFCSDIGGFWSDCYSYIDLDYPLASVRWLLQPTISYATEYILSDNLLRRFIGSELYLMTSPSIIDQTLVWIAMGGKKVPLHKAEEMVHGGGGAKGRNSATYEYDIDRYTDPRAQLIIEAIRSNGLLGMYNTGNGQDIDWEPASASALADKDEYTHILNIGGDPLFAMQGNGSKGQQMLKRYVIDPTSFRRGGVDYVKDAYSAVTTELVPYLSGHLRRPGVDMAKKALLFNDMVAYYYDRSLAENVNDAAAAQLMQTLEEGKLADRYNELHSRIAKVDAALGVANGKTSLADFVASRWFLASQGAWNGAFKANGDAFSDRMQGVLARLHERTDVGKVAVVTAASPSGALSADAQALVAAAKAAIIS